VTRACALEVRRLVRRLERDLRRAVREVLAEIFGENRRRLPPKASQKKARRRARAVLKHVANVDPVEGERRPAQLGETTAEDVAGLPDIGHLPATSELLEARALELEWRLEAARAAPPLQAFALGDVVDVALESKIVRGRIIEKKPGDFYRVEPLPIGYQWKPKIVHASEIEALVIAGV
jgi:hypothetical protein